MEDCERQRREATIAEGKKLGDLPERLSGGGGIATAECAIAECKKPLTTRGSGECHKLPQRIEGRSSRSRHNFEHFNAKCSKFLLLFISNFKK